MNDDFGVAAAVDAVRIERDLPGPIERIWAYLTDPDLRARWLAGGEMEQHVGGRVALHFHHASLSPHPGPTPARFRSMENGTDLTGAITACEPPRVLAYTWGDGEGASEVRFELETLGDGRVRLRILHSLLPDGHTMAQVAGGWHSHLAILADRLQDREPANFWTIFEPVEAEYMRRFGAERP